ncbi:MAG: RpoL/Rpb11 RNA polymerase subunit family protein [Nitrososphaerales archaeon]
MMMMEIKVLSSSERALLVDIEDEDISILEIIQHELLKDDRVVFAGWAQRHPLLKRINMRVQTKATEPLKVLISGSSKASEKASELISEAKKTSSK